MLIDSAAVNYWTQPGLVPRDPGRGDRFENACFFGNPEEMLADGHRLATELGRLGLTWRIVPRAEWHDYREVDVVVAVRPEDERAAKQKPASKLTNAWLAGVPAVLSPDPAFEELRQSPLDYLSAQSVPDILRRVTELRDDVSLRRAMRDNGLRRSPEVAPERSVRQWTEILRDQVIPRYEEWTRSPFKRVGLYGVRTLVDMADRLVGPLRTRLAR